MRTERSVLYLAITVVLLLSFAATLNAAPDPADIGFYKGKLVTYIVATKPGGGYDTYARAIGKYLQKHLPGSTVVVKNVPGAGHIIGANEMVADGVNQPAENLKMLKEIIKIP